MLDGEKEVVDVGAGGVVGLFLCRSSKTWLQRSGCI